jgi:hypothetical protein
MVIERIVYRPRMMANVSPITFKALPGSILYASHPQSASRPPVIANRSIPLNVFWKSVLTPAGLGMLPFR